MSLTELRERVAAANRALAENGLVDLSFGNASGVDLARGVMAIKASGVSCAQAMAEHMVVVRLSDGSVVEGSMRPSSDTPTHLVLYQELAGIGAIVHTHSRCASAWAQAGRSIPCLGTTHADHFAGPVPVTRPLTDGEISDDYERRTGEVIAETLDVLGIEPLRMPAVLVQSHGPFVWGADPAEAVTNAAALELVAMMAMQTLAIAADTSAIGDALLSRHFSRKHGPAAYYGQPRIKPLS